MSNIKSDEQFRAFIADKKAATEFLVKELPEFTSTEAEYFLVTGNSYLNGDQPVSLFKTDLQRLLDLAKSYLHPADVF